MFSYRNLDSRTRAVRAMYHKCSDSDLLALLDFMVPDYIVPAPRGWQVAETFAPDSPQLPTLGYAMRMQTLGFDCWISGDHMELLIDVSADGRPYDSIDLLAPL